VRYRGDGPGRSARSAAPGDRKVTVDEIQQRVAAHYNIKLAENEFTRRARSVARPRQVAMYLRQAAHHAQPAQIGKRFGNRDHTTVMHAVRKIEELKVSDLSIAETSNCSSVS